MTKKTHTMRAITLPVARPIGAEWTDVRPLLRASFDQSRQLHRWLVRQLMRLDSAPPEAGEGGRSKLPKMPALPTVARDGYSLYLQARQVASLLNSGTVAQIVQDVTRRYKQDRFRVFMGQASFCDYRRAVLPVRKQELDCNPLTEVDGTLQVGFPFADPQTGRVVWTRWQLKGGRRYGRAARGARLAARGAGCEVRALYFLERPRRGSPGTDLYCKIVVKQPLRSGDPESRGDLLVSTDSDALLRYISGGAKLPTRGKEAAGWLRYDHVPRLLAQRRRRIQRGADDLKKERRSPRRKRDRMITGQRERLDKISRALDNAVKCAAREIVNVALRRRVERLVYRDTREKDGKRVPEDRFVSGFRWHALRTRIATLCEDHGLEFVYDEDGSLIPEQLPDETTLKELIHEHASI